MNTISLNCWYCREDFTPEDQVVTHDERHPLHSECAKTQALFTKSNTYRCFCGSTVDVSSLLIVNDLKNGSMVSTAALGLSCSFLAAGNPLFSAAVPFGVYYQSPKKDRLFLLGVMATEFITFIPLYTLSNFATAAFGSILAGSLAGACSGYLSRKFEWLKL